MDLPGQFELFYQPTLDLRDGSVRSCEALLRWWHPDFGILRPGASLDGTRWAAQIPNIERWALAAACHQATAWRSHGHELLVAVNVSKSFLFGPDLLSTIDEALAVAGAHPSQLAIDLPLAAWRPILDEWCGSPPRSSSEASPPQSTGRAQA